jgi:hypothetical protein
MVVRPKFVAVAHSRSGLSRAARRLALPLAILVSAPLLAACGSTATMPDVVGMRLDEAHRVLEEMGMENFDDTDVMGEIDGVWRDANWIVVEQNPSAGTAEVDTGTTIELSVGNEDEAEEVLAAIPPDSPFAREYAAQAAEDEEDQEAEQEKAEQEAEQEKAEAVREAEAAAEERREDAAAYAQTIDDTFGTTLPHLVKLYSSNADRVHAEGGGPVVAAQNAIASRDSFDQILTIFNTKDVSPPESLSGVKALSDVEDRMRNAVAGFVVASEQLIDAIDTQAPSAFAEELNARRLAISDWNQAMRDIYGTAKRRPKLIPVS